MRDIKLKYSILGIPFGFKRPVPSGWRDLSPRQFIAATHLYFGDVETNKFLQEFYNLPRLSVISLTDFQRWKLLDLIDYVRDSRVPCSQFLIPVITGTKLMAPAPMLNGMCLQQFMTVDTFFNKYAISKKEEFLNLFISSLYLAKNERFIVTEKGHRLLDLNARSEEIKKVDLKVKEAIFMNFTLIKTWLAKAYTHLFPEADQDDTDKKTGKPVDWLEVFDHFVGDNIPDMETYRAMECTDAFRVLNRKIKEAKKNGNK